MNEEPKSIWKKSWTGPHWLRAWLILAAATFVILLIIILFLPGGPRSLLDWAPALAALLGVSLVSATVFVGLWLFIRCFFNWRNFKRLLFGLVCFATLIGLFYAVENFRGKLAWNSFKREWEAKGEKFDWQALVPPPVPDDQNFALTPVVASSYEMFFDKTGHELQPRNTNVVDRLSMLTWRDNRWTNSPKFGSWLVAKKTDLQAWQGYFRSPPPTNSSRTDATNSFPQSAQPQSPAEDILQALSKYDSNVAELRQASRLPYSRFPLTYGNDDPAAILLPHLSALKYAAQALSLRAVAALQNDQAEKALEDVALSLRLTDSIRTEPSQISHLVRLAMLQLTLQPVYEGLADHRWSNAQLAKLDAELAKLDFLADYEFCQRGELGFIPKYLEYCRRTRNPNLFWFDYGNNQNHSFEDDLRVFVFQHCPSGWFYQNQLRYCRFVIHNFLPPIDAPRQLAFPAAASRASDAQLKKVARLNPYNFIEYRLLFPPSGVIKPNKLAGQFAYGQSSVNLARTALALERYRLAHGTFPDSLDALVPQFIAKLPHDLIGGQSLHYRRTEAGKFLLYSIGWNEKDDGGVVALNKDGKEDQENGDWVWPMPVK